MMRVFLYELSNAISFAFVVTVQSGGIQALRRHESASVVGHLNCYPADRINAFIDDLVAAQIFQISASSGLIDKQENLGHAVQLHRDREWLRMYPNRSKGSVRRSIHGERLEMYAEAALPLLQHVQKGVRA